MAFGGVEHPEPYPVEAIAPLHVRREVLTDREGASLASDVLDDSGIPLVVAEDPREALAFTEKNGRIDFVLPKLEGHQMIELA